MERRRTPIRRAGLAAAALLLCTGLAACGRNTLVGPAPVAVVDGRSVSQGDLDTAISIDQEIARYVAKNPAAASAQLTSAKVFDTKAPTLATADVATSLTSLLQLRLVQHAVAAAGLHVTAADRAAARARVSDGLTANNLKIDDLPKRFVDEQVEFAALQGALDRRTRVSQAKLRAAYQATAVNYTESECVSVIATKAQEAAQAAYQRLSSGEAFKKVFDDLNVDASVKASGGAIGCGSLEQVARSFGQTVATADVGTPLAPTAATAGGEYVVPVITSRKVRPLTDPKVKAAVTALVQQPNTTKLLQAELRRAKVWVSSRYGSWDAETASVVPPDTPDTTTTVVSSTTAAAAPAGS